MANEQIIQGNLRRIKATFKDINSNLVDPTTVTIKVRPGKDAATISYVYPGVITRDGLGVFYYDLTLNTPGTWSYQVISTGAVVTTSKIFHFDVVPAVL